MSWRENVNGAVSYPGENLRTILKIFKDLSPNLSKILEVPGTIIEVSCNVSLSGSCNDPSVLNDS